MNYHQNHIKCNCCAYKLLVENWMLWERKAYALGDGKFAQPWLISKNYFCNANNALLRNKKDYCDDYIPFFAVKFDNTGKRKYADINRGS